MQVTAHAPPRRFRLLPEDSYRGWAPYLWLVYFPIFFAAPLARGASPASLSSEIGIGVLFLLLYFRGFWVHGTELVLIIVAIALMGFALAPQNNGATVFITYAAAFSGALRSRSRAIGALCILCAAVALAALLDPAHRTVWLFEIAIAGTIGAANIHFERVRVMNLALRQARAEVEQLARMAERERIARDLHDVLGHTLTLITLKSALAARVAERDPARAIVEMLDVERVSREALQEVRAAVSGQRDVGLAGELRNAREMLGAGGIAVEYAASPITFSPTEEATLALALREAVTNVVRHAHASRCRITLMSEASARSMSVEDDGRGRLGDDGSGLSGMRERVQAVGGALVVDDGMLGGTRVQITLPGVAA